MEPDWRIGSGVDQVPANNEKYTTMSLQCTAEPGNSKEAAVLKTLLNEELQLESEKKRLQGKVLDLESANKELMEINARLVAEMQRLQTEGT